MTTKIPEDLVIMVGGGDGEAVMSDDEIDFFPVEVGPDTESFFGSEHVTVRDVIVRTNEHPKLIAALKKWAACSACANPAPKFRHTCDFDEAQKLLEVKG